MVLARYEQTLVDEAGNILVGAQVTVRRETSGSPIADIYSDRAGVNHLANPFAVGEDGLIAFYAPGGAYRITAVRGSFSKERRYVGVGRGSETDISALIPRGEWDAITTFAQGDLVRHSGRLFASIDGDNLNHTPPASESDNDYWMFIPTSESVQLVEQYAEEAEAAADVATGLASAFIIAENTFATIATAEAWEPVAAPAYIRTAGYAAAGDGGGALYKSVVSEPSHPGKFSITLADGVTTKWYELAEDMVSVLALGADRSGGVDSTAAIQNAWTVALAVGRDVYLPAGTFKIGAGSVGLNFDHSAVGHSAARVPSIVGAGPELTRLNAAAGDYTAITYKAYNGADVGAKFVTISGFIVGKPSLDELGTGLLVQGMCFFRVERVAARGFAYGVKGVGAFSGVFEQPWLYGNGVNLDLDMAVGDDVGLGTDYYPNAILISHAYISGATSWGIHAKGPSELRIVGGSVEGNGALLSYQCGIWIENAGKQGRVGAVIDGVYFEDNGGRADILISNSSDPCLYAVRNCTFSRFGTSRYTTANIDTDFDAGVVQHLALSGNGHADYSPYTSSAARPYIKHSDAVPRTTGLESCYFRDVAAHTTTSKIPSFEANDDTAANVINTDAAILPFNANIRGSGVYNASTSRFTAPYPGLYLFCCTLGIDSVTTQGAICFGKNGTAQQDCTVRFTGVEPVNLTRVLSLSAGDIVDVRSVLAGGAAFQYRGFISTFSGQFLSPQ